MMFKNCCCSVGGTQQDVKMEVGGNQLMSLQPPAFCLLTPQATSPLPSLTLGAFKLLFLTFSRVFYKKKISKSNRKFDKSYILDESIETSKIYKEYKIFVYIYDAFGRCISITLVWCVSYPQSRRNTSPDPNIATPLLSTLIQTKKQQSPVFHPCVQQHGVVECWIPSSYK